MDFETKGIIETVCTIISTICKVAFVVGALYFLSDIN